MSLELELGLDTFGDVTLDADGLPLPPAQVIRHVVEEAVLADRLGVDFIGLGEHHRPDFAISAPEVVLRPSPPARRRSGSSSDGIRNQWRCTAPATSPRPTSRHGTSFGRTTRPCTPASGGSAAGHP